MNKFKNIVIAMIICLIVFLVVVFSVKYCLTGIFEDMSENDISKLKYGIFKIER